jgi:ATP-dependent Lhr-like helicase
VALSAGEPVAVFERQGRLLRIFDESVLNDALKAFAQAYSARRVFPEQRRLTVKQYPQQASAALSQAGFSQAAQDYELYRGYD